MRMKSCQSVLIVAMLLAMVGGATAQEFRATVKGQVVDSSQAALPGATVTVHNQQTNEVATAVTNNDGLYTIPFLRPGLYTVTVELAGFQKYNRTDMRLEVSQVAVVNAQLGVGGVTESINVSADAPLLETSKADRGTVIDQARIAELPLQSRSPIALATLIAGVTYNAQAIYLRPFDNGALADFSMNGGQNRNNEFLLDGAPNNANQGGNNIAYVPPADAVQEFKMQTNSYDAQYGRTAGGVMNMSLKSGTNAFHGTAYEYYRRKWLDANSFLLNARGTPKVEHYLDQYGFEIDGPVKIPGLYNGTNKTFFMFNGEKYREGTPAAQFSSVPTPAMKNGDFSKLVDAQGRPIIIYDPATGRDVNGVWTRDAFPGNIIPANRIDPVGQGDCCSTTRIPTARRRDSPTGSRTSATPSTSTRTCSGTGSARSTTTSARTIACSSGMGRTRATRSGTRLRFAAARRKTVSCRSSAATTRSSATGCTSWAAAQSSTCAAATPTTWRAASPTTPSASTRRNWDGPRASSRSSRRRKSAACSPSSTRTISSRCRADSGQTRTRFTPSSRTSRSRAAITTSAAASTSRLTNVVQHELRQRRRTARFLPLHLYSQHAEHHQYTGRQYLRGLPARRAVRGQRARQPVPTLSLDVRRTVDSGRLARLEQTDPEPRVPVGLQQPRSRTRRSAELHLRSVDSEPDRFEGRSAGDGRTDVPDVNGAPSTPYKYDKNNYQGRAGMAYQINDKTVFRAGYGKYFLNPTGQGQTQGFSLSTQLISSNDCEPDADSKYPVESVPERDPDAARQLAGTVDEPRARPDVRQSELRDSERAPVLDRHSARAAVEGRARGQLRRQPKLRRAGKLGRVQ